MVTDSGRSYFQDTIPVKQQVVTHLNFFKSIIDEGRNGDRINDYLEMIEHMDEETYYQISKDPFECAIASVFKLVINEKMDPWDIELEYFASVYLEQAREKEKVNFVVAGRLIRMAWSVLEMQCREVLNTAENEKQQEEAVQDEFISGWDIFECDYYDEPEDIDFESELLDSDTSPIHQAVRREQKEPVSLMQLVSAFEEAKKEAKYREKMERIRKEKVEKRKKQEEEHRENYDTNAHKEDLHQDIEMIWERICWYDQDDLDFDMIYDGSLTDMVTAFMSCLFLHRDNKIKLGQKVLPDGKIKIVNLVPENERPEGMIRFIAEKEDGSLLENIVTVPPEDEK